MASSPPPSAASRKSLGFLENVKKRKHSYIQFFAMTGILVLSFRSLRQKFLIHRLNEDAAALEEEQIGLTARMSQIKRSLLAEAALEPTGASAARLRLIFGDASN